MGARVQSSPEMMRASQMSSTQFLRDTLYALELDQGSDAESAQVTEEVIEEEHSVLPPAERMQSLLSETADSTTSRQSADGNSKHLPRRGFARIEGLRRCLAVHGLRDAEVEVIHRRGLYYAVPLKRRRDSAVLLRTWGDTMLDIVSLRSKL